MYCLDYDDDCMAYIAVIIFSMVDLRRINLGLVVSHHPKVLFTQTVCPGAVTYLFILVYGEGLWFTCDTKLQPNESAIAQGCVKWLGKVVKALT